MNATKTQQHVITTPEVIADDDRGVIEKLAEDVHTVLRITSKKGTVRANHYHRKDTHLCYVAKGKIRYVEKPAEDDNAPMKEYTVESGQLFYTGPMIVHAMEFLENSEFYCFTPRSGKQDEYEDDVVRVELIKQK